MGTEVLRGREKSFYPGTHSENQAGLKLTEIRLPLLPEC